MTRLDLWRKMAAEENARMRAHGRAGGDPRDYSTSSGRILARRERVAELYRAGLTYPEIASEAGISRSTVRKDLEALVVMGNLRWRYPKGVQGGDHA